MGLLQVGAWQVTLVRVPNNAGTQRLNARLLMNAKLLMTRPPDDSDRFVSALRAKTSRQFDVIVSPLFEIAPLEVAGFDHDPDHFIFSSSNAVRQADHLGLARRGIAWCVGDQTAVAARELGFDSRSAGGNGNDLLALIAAQRPKGRILHVHGRKTYINFARELGGQCTGICAYDQVELPLTDKAVAALKGTDDVIVPLFSPRTASILLRNAMITAPVRLIGISLHTVQALDAAKSSLKWQIAKSPDLDGMIEATRLVFEAL